MTSIHFYQLLTTPLERALPKLLEKAFFGGFKTLLLTDSDERADYLDQLLWTYDPGSFLPHGTSKGDTPQLQPILISPHNDAINNARLLLVTNGHKQDEPNVFERIIDIFDGNDAQALQNARTRWASYKNSGCELAYLRQTESGGWEKKAIA